MSRPNAYYNPKWEEIYNLHEEQRDLRDKRSNELAMMLSEGEQYKADYQATLECFDFHHKICLYCLDTMQHPTIEAFWDWIKAFTGKNSFTSEDGTEVYTSEQFSTVLEAKKFVNDHLKRQMQSTTSLAA